MQNLIIKIKNVSKRFGNEVVLQNVNLEIKKGRIIGLIGRNGSGKTVLLKIIAGLYIPDEGDIFIKSGLSIYEDFGFLIDTGFLENDTGFDNLYNLALIKNQIKKEDIINIMNFVRLDPFSKTKYQNYSTGMKQKLKIAQSIMEHPKILVLDEPFNGLDKESVNYFRMKFKELREMGTTLIITSHYQEDINELCDEVYEMIGGKLIEYEKK